MSRSENERAEPHVLTLTPFFPSTDNPVSGCFVAETVESLRKLGVQANVMAVSPFHYAVRYATSAAPADWVRYLQIPGNLGLPTAGNFLYSRLLERVKRLHARNTIDVIHAHAALPCGHAAMLLSSRLRIPFVVTVHGLDVFNSCYQSGKAAAWRRDVSLRTYRAAETVICISGKVQTILKAGCPPDVRSTIVYNAVDSNLFSSDSGDGLGILVVGTLLPSKGHELVLRALKSLERPHPDLHCSIIGEGPYRAKFENLASELGIGRRVHFLGRQSRVEVAEAMRRCSVFVLPSRNEAFGCVYLEAMACGKPVIGCYSQGIDEVIDQGKNGWLIPPDGLEELTQALSVLLGSPEVSKKIGMAARETVVKKFTLWHQAEHLLTIYRGITAAKAAPPALPRVAGLQ